MKIWVCHSVCYKSKIYINILDPGPESGKNLSRSRCPSVCLSVESKIGLERSVREELNLIKIFSYLGAFSILMKMSKKN